MEEADCLSVLEEIRDLLVSVEAQVHQIYLWVLLFVSVTFAILLIYLLLRPFLFFLDR